MFAALMRLLYHLISDCVKGQLKKEMVIHPLEQLTVSAEESLQVFCQCARNNAHRRSRMFADTTS